MTTSRLTEGVQSIVDEFFDQPGVTAKHAENLRQTIASSPAMIEQLDSAVAAGNVQRLGLMTHQNAAGEYHPDTKTVRLSVRLLEAPAENVSFNTGNTLFVLAHAVQHGINDGAVRQSRIAFNQTTLAKAPQSGVHDYTDDLETMLDANRRDESSAEIAGFNVVVSQVMKDHTAPRLRQINDAAPGLMGRYIERNELDEFVLTPGLCLDQGVTLSETPRNWKRSGRHSSTGCLIGPGLVPGDAPTTPIFTAPTQSP